MVEWEHALKTTNALEHIFQFIMYHFVNLALAFLLTPFSGPATK